jgi:hypothetical protein
VPGCLDCAGAMLPIGPSEYFPICERHANAWAGSWVRSRLYEVIDLVGYAGAKHAWDVWCRTEALGKDPKRDLYVERFAQGALSALAKAGSFST